MLVVLLGTGFKKGKYVGNHMNLLKQLWTSMKSREIELRQAQLSEVYFYRSNHSCNCLYKGAQVPIKEQNRTWGEIESDVWTHGRNVSRLCGSICMMQNLIMFSSSYLWSL
jgi:hypothetical protein